MSIETEFEIFYTDIDIGKVDSFNWLIRKVLCFIFVIFVSLRGKKLLCG